MKKKVKIPIFYFKKFFSDSVAIFIYNVNQKPIKVGIDPMNKFVDLIVDDNIVRIKF